MARRSKRYAFLALYECQNPETKRKIFNQVAKTEKASGNRFFERFIDLKDEDYLKELQKTYEEYEKEQEKKSASPASAEKSEKKEEKTVKPSEAGRYSETNVEQRVRFKNEQRVARLLIDHDFDQSEDIIRKYIDDYNYKLIEATFIVLSTDDGAKEAGAKIDYTKFKLHHQDNYVKVVDEKKTLLHEVAELVKVEDDVHAIRAEEKKGAESSGKPETDAKKGAVDGSGK